MTIKERYKSLLQSIENHELVIKRLYKDIENLQALCPHPEVENHRVAPTVIEKTCICCGFKSTQS